MNYRDAFWAQVDVRGVDECWLWKGAVAKSGHGTFKGQLSHRLAVFFSGVPLGNRVDVHHTCSEKRCCSPFHLQPLKHRDHSRVTRQETTHKENS